MLDTLEGIKAQAELDWIKARDIAYSKGVKPKKGPHRAPKATLINEFLRQKELADPRLMTIIISQVRQNIGAMFGETKTRHCKDALEFWSSIIIYLRVAQPAYKTHKGRRYEIGQTIQAQIKKNKVIGSKHNPYFKIRNGHGIDDVDGNICFLYGLLTPEGKMKDKIPVMYWKSQEYKTRMALIQHIENNNQERELIDACDREWNDIEQALAPSERKRRF